MGEQKKKRIQHTPGDFKSHIDALHDRRIETEARRIVENMKRLGAPDSPEKTQCAVEISPYFVPLATDKDMERLFSMLPYKSLSFSTLEDRHGVYALIDKSEKNKEIKKSRPDRLTVEEMNLLSIYHEGSKAQLIENMTAALPFMDEDMRELAKRTLAKIAPLTENEYAELAIFAADEV